MKVHRIFFSLLLGVLGSPCAAAENSLESTLQSQFQDKVLLLLHPASEESLQFDAGGKPLHSYTSGPWTVFGGVRIHGVQLAAGRLRLHGQRVFYTFTSDGLTVLDFNLIENRKNPPCQPPVEIAINLERPLNSMEAARAVLGSVFAFNKKDFLDSMPAFWRAYARQHLDFDPARPGELIHHSEQPAPMSVRVPSKPPETKPSEPGELIHHSEKPAPMSTRIPSKPPETKPSDAPGRPELTVMAPAYKVSGDVTGPRPLYTPEPEYSVAALYEKYQGTVRLSVIVDKLGKILTADIQKPVGLGLDDQAVQDVKSWWFTPSRRNGETVLATINIEVAFNLY